MTVEFLKKRIDEIYEKCARIAEKHSPSEAAAKIREEATWEGLSCGCGGGWKVGHRNGCPEVEGIL